MWLFASAIIVCFTMIVLFRIYLDLRSADHRHERLMQSDRFDQQRYVDVVSRPKPKAEMPDFSRTLPDNRAYRVPQLPPAGYITNKGYPTDYTQMEMEYMDREMQRMAIEELNRRYGPRRGTL